MQDSPRWVKAVQALERENEMLKGEIALLLVILDLARNSYDVNDYPAERGELYQAIAAYDAAHTEETDDE